MGAFGLRGPANALELAIERAVVRLPDNVIRNPILRTIWNPKTNMYSINEATRIAKLILVPGEKRRVAEEADKLIQDAMEKGGDMDKAVEYLREKGLAASAKKAGRIAAEGMAYATVIDGVGVVVEVNAETDFVGKNDKFVSFVKGVAATVAAEKPADLDALMACKFAGTELTVTEQQQEMVLVIGENIKVRRFAFFTEGVSVAYVHAGGKIGVLVNLDTDLTAEQVEEMGKDAAMQIAALNPRFWDKSQVTEDVLENEKKIMLAQMANDPKMANKPEQVREKIVVGKLNKFYTENCLLQQEFVKDGDLTVEKYLTSAAKALGGKVTFKDAVRFEKGEGIEKKQENFAAEIASMVKG